MKHRVKMDVVTEKKGLFGMKKVVEQKTVTVSGREYRQIQQAKRKADDRAKAQKLAEAFIILEDEIAEEYGEDW